MTATPTFDAKLDDLGKASKRAAALGMLGFILLIGSIVFAALRVSFLQKEQKHLQDSIVDLNNQIKTLELRSRDLTQTQNGVLDFLGGVTAANHIRLIDQSVNWPETKLYLENMEAGPRKKAVLDALLLAWKNLPFSLGNRSLSSGLDSPHFINTILIECGVHVDQRPDERLSDAMMRQFKIVDAPMPGDLIFYKGNVGSFVLMYIGPGSSAGKGIAVGTLQTGEEVQVVDTAHINTPYYPFIGFYRVPYHK